MRREGGRPTVDFVLLLLNAVLASFLPLDADLDWLPLGTDSRRAGLRDAIEGAILCAERVEAGLDGRAAAVEGESADGTEGCQLWRPGSRTRRKCSTDRYDEGMVLEMGVQVIRR